jgi:hypothetical protein
LRRVHGLEDRRDHALLGRRPVRERATDRSYGADDDVELHTIWFGEREAAAGASERLTTLANDVEPQVMVPIEVDPPNEGVDESLTIDRLVADIETVLESNLAFRATFNSGDWRASARTARTQAQLGSAIP